MKGDLILPNLGELSELLSDDNWCFRPLSAINISYNSLKDRFVPERMSNYSRKK